MLPKRFRATTTKEKELPPVELVDDPDLRARMKRPRDQERKPTLESLKVDSPRPKRSKKKSEPVD